MKVIQRQRVGYLLAGILFALYMLLFSTLATAQDDRGYIYGKITTVDDKTYIGQIRWGKEETFWDDIFNSSKGKNPHLQHLKRGDYEHLRNYRGEDSKWDFWSIWDDHYSSYAHSFATRFGDIKSITILGRDDVEIEFRDGQKMEFGGGSNDIGASLRVFDEEIGELKIKWNRIDRVEFMSTPKKLQNKFGDPLYGTVETSIGSFTGLVQWDHEECLTNDRLDGDSEDGDVSIPFGNIKSIERQGRGSLVTFKSGRELFLTGSNDVNSDNRGVIVKNPEFGKVKIEWREFEKVTFDTNNQNSGEAYTKYSNPLELEGTVTTINDQEFNGRIVFDLDEEWDYELLNGSDEEIEYIIPFRNIKSVRPKNFNYSTIELRSGRKLFLGDGQDVTDQNDGILVFRKKGDPVYIPWPEVKEVVFK